jgi:carboxypeptidase D
MTNLVQLLIYLAEYLVRGYGNDQRVTRLLDRTEIFLLPSLNPDGFLKSSEGCSFIKRYVAGQ